MRRELDVVDSAGTTLKPLIYLATDETYIDDSLEPYDWYLRHVVQGARHHRLPPAYVVELEKVPTKPDPDAERIKLQLSYPCDSVMSGPCPE